ncbi:MAG: hypothetical protein ACR2P4_00370, partial [Gammaproteobacteria bacterium]
KSPERAAWSQHGATPRESAHPINQALKGRPKTTAANVITGGTPFQGYGYKSAHIGGRGIVALQQCDRLSLAR